MMIVSLVAALLAVAFMLGIEKLLGTTPCSRCSKRVRDWFLEQFPAGGVLATPGDPTREAICRHCTEGWPYPKWHETEDRYVDRLKGWREEERKTRKGGGASPK
jgi:hypothetical protein